MMGRLGIARWCAALVLAVSLLGGPARANDRVDDLAKMLVPSASDKARLSAVAALGRLDDRAALKPLVGALRDANPQVRALAAAALGKLGHKAALPALKHAADDPDPTVRKRAREAALAVAKANQLPDPWPAPPPTTTGKRKHGGRAGFGRQGHAVVQRPDLYVTINSVADDSPGTADKTTRKRHGQILRQTLASSFQDSPLVTTTAADARRWGLAPRHLDLSVTQLSVSQVGPYIEVEAQLRLAISDRSGKMLSFLSGGAKVQVPKKTYNARYLPNLRREALENAMRGMFQKLLAHLRDKRHS